MTTIETTSRIALVLTLAATAAVQRSAYADSSAGAQVQAVTSAASPAATVAPSDSSLRYSLPWQLRPVTIGNLARVDSVAAVFNDANGNLDEAVATVVTASYQMTGNWAPMVRLGFVGNDAPGEATDGSSFANPLIGATYARALGNYRLALFGATTLPLGTGGGDAPNIRAAKTNAASSAARPADDAMFAVNYTTAIAGADFAYVGHGFTAQGEMTLLQFVRVRGGDSGGATDAFRTAGGGGPARRLLLRLALLSEQRPELSALALAPDDPRRECGSPGHVLGRRHEHDDCRRGPARPFQVGQKWLDSPRYLVRAGHRRARLRCAFAHRPGDRRAGRRSGDVLGVYGDSYASHQET